MTSSRVNVIPDDLQCVILFPRHGDVALVKPSRGRFVTAFAVDYVQLCMLGKSFISSYFAFSYRGRNLGWSSAAPFRRRFLLLLFHHASVYRIRVTPVADVVRANHFQTEEPRVA